MPKSILNNLNVKKGITNFSIFLDANSNENDLSKLAFIVTKAKLEKGSLYDSLKVLEILKQYIDKNIISHINDKIIATLKKGDFENYMFLVRFVSNLILHYIQPLFLDQLLNIY